MQTNTDTCATTGRIRIRRQGDGYVIEKNGRLLGMIWHLNAVTAMPHGAHWAVLHINGRIDRFDSFSEARNEALKL